MREDGSYPLDRSVLSRGAAAYGMTGVAGLKTALYFALVKYGRPVREFSPTI